jgi:hypothetical protein
MEIKKRLTNEELRSFTGMENLSDEKAEEVITTLERLSVLFFNLYQQKKEKQEELNNQRRTEDERNKEPEQKLAA